MKTVLKISGLTAPETILRARQIVTSMTGNANFTTPSPSLASITSAANASESAYEAALDGGHTLKYVAKLKLKTLTNGLVLLAAYVDNVSQGDDAKILSSGMYVRAAKTPSPIPDQVIDLGATSGRLAGEVSLRWKKVNKAKTYRVEMSADAVNNWTQQGLFTKAKCTLTGLNSGDLIWFRVFAIGAAGEGAASDPAQARVK